MAYITLDPKRLKKNYDYLNSLFKRNDIKWSIVTKILSGHKAYLNEVLKLGIKQVSDSRVSNLKIIKEINPNVETIYIKPPAKGSIEEIIQFADISVNTEAETIRMLSAEAQKQNKKHKIIIMIEMGELREGVMREDFIEFFGEVFTLKNIEVVGIGTNLSCLYGVLPNHDKLIQLSLYEQLVEAKFDRLIPFVSGGSSVTIPLIFQHLLPKGVNHFRVGETLFLGTDVYNNQPFKQMHHNVFQLYAEIIELIEKPVVPIGDMGTNVDGNSYDFDDEELGKTSYRALIDLGLLDVDEKHIEPVDKSLNFVGASSDMIVVDLGENQKDYKVGDVLEFEMDYMGVLRIVNSKYIEKRIKS